MNIIAAASQRWRDSRRERAAAEMARQDAFIRDNVIEDVVSRRHRIEADASTREVNVIRFTPVGVFHGTAPAEVLGIADALGSPDGPPDDDTVEDLRELFKQHPEKF